MATNLMKTAVKLQKAINSKGYRVVITTSQFFAETRNQPITVYHVKTSNYDSEKHSVRQDELFKSASTVDLVLFLAALWDKVSKENTDVEGN